MPKCKPITAQNRERWYLLRAHGCVACRKRSLVRYPEIHHILSGGRRTNHDTSIPLCSWHHRGEPARIDWTKTQTERWLGPSMAEDKRAFVAQFGSEQEQLQEIENWLQNSTEKGGVKRGLEGRESSLPF